MTESLPLMFDRRFAQVLVVTVPVLTVLFLTSALRAGDREETVLSRIAFGSCAKQDQPQPIWDAIVESDPDVFLFIGDNIYGDSEEMDVLRGKWQQLGRVAGYQRLKATCPILATWDDHDYGKNDAGSEYAMKVESQKLFLDFFDEPADSPRRQRPGVYHSYRFGPDGRRVQVILLRSEEHTSELQSH